MRASRRTPDATDAPGRPVLRGRPAILAIGDRGGRRRYRLGASRPAPPELGKAVSQLKPGELSAPIRTGGGYYLMLVVDRRTGTSGERCRTTSLRYRPGGVSAAGAVRAKRSRRAAMSEADECARSRQGLPEPAENRQGEGAATVERGQAAGCQTSRRRCAIWSPGWRSGRRRSRSSKRTASASSWCAAKSTSAHGGGDPRRSQSESLLRQRLDTVARRYLRDLRRNAYVDVRA